MPETLPPWKFTSNKKDTRYGNYCYCCFFFLFGNVYIHFYISSAKEFNCNIQLLFKTIPADTIRNQALSTNYSFHGSDLSGIDFSVKFSFGRHNSEEITAQTAKVKWNHLQWLHGTCHWYNICWLNTVLLVLPSLLPCYLRLGEMVALNNY